MRPTRKYVGVKLRKLNYHKTFGIANEFVKFSPEAQHNIYIDMPYYFTKYRL